VARVSPRIRRAEVQVKTIRRTCAKETQYPTKKAEDRRRNQETGGRNQKTEDRGQRTKGGQQKTEDRSQRSKPNGQKTRDTIGTTQYEARVTSDGRRIYADFWSRKPSSLRERTGCWSLRMALASTWRTWNDGLRR
jgi:hypothetical protein